jgi:hypothetical protein
MFAGVAFPVGTPSMLTAAPDGNELILSAPFCANAGLTANVKTTARSTFELDGVMVHNAPNRRKTDQC